MAPTTDKSALRDRLCGVLEAELDRITASQREAQAGAVHAEARAEGTKDMRSTETSYLARGLAMRVEELRDAVLKVRNMRLRAFGDEDPIEVSAVVDVEDDEGRATRYFVVPAGAGSKIAAAQGTIVAVTPQSPLGAALMGKLVGDDAAIRSPGGARTVSIEAVT